MDLLHFNLLKLFGPGSSSCISCMFMQAINFRRQTTTLDIALRLTGTVKYVNINIVCYFYFYDFYIRSIDDEQVAILIFCNF